MKEITPNQARLYLRYMTLNDQNPNTELVRMLENEKDFVIARERLREHLTKIAESELKEN